MTDHSDLIERARAACVGHPSASIAWPHRILHEAADALSSQSLSLSEAREEIERLTKERDQARSDYEQEADWSKAVDQHGLDGFDDLAARWLTIDAIQRMHNAAASVFTKWSNDELMGRFKAHMTRIMHTAFVEGAIVGVRTATANATHSEALENGPAGLADAHTNPPLSDLSSLRKGAEVADKPLEWRHDNAHSVIGRYWITYTGGKIGLHLDQRKIGKFADPDEAKSAAQSDFETRIRSALVSGSREDGE